jgi:predicted DNA-binding WGR domain protein
MRCFYALSLQPDLFGTVSVVKEWGRIGRPGTVRHEVYADETVARDALVLRMQKKAIGLLSFIARIASRKAHLGY